MQDSTYGAWLAYGQPYDRLIFRQPTTPIWEGPTGPTIPFSSRGARSNQIPARARVGRCLSKLFPFSSLDWFCSSVISIQKYMRGAFWHPGTAAPGICAAQNAWG